MKRCTRHEHANLDLDALGFQPLDEGQMSRIVGGMSDTGWKFFCGLGYMLGMNDGKNCGTNPYTANPA